MSIILWNAAFFQHASDLFNPMSQQRLPHILQFWPQRCKALIGCSSLQTAQIKVRVCPDTVLCISLSQGIWYPYVGCIEPCSINGPKRSQVTWYTPWTDSSEFGQALTCTTCWDGWTQPYSHIGKGNVWSAELLPGPYWLRYLGLHWVKKEFRYYNDVFTIWAESYYMGQLSHGNSPCTHGKTAAS